MSNAATARELAPGTLFSDRYRIEGLLGKGGMGVVYRAYDLHLAEPIALKLLLVELASSPSLALRFRQEVKLSRRIHHPNVIRVHDIGQHVGLLYMTMELVAGETLRAALSRHPGGMPLDQALYVARAIALALGAAHEASVFHRDIKPTNVLIGENGRVVVMDFGIARCPDEDLGLTCGMLGTVRYMAPEQASSGPIDERTDLYALGLVMHEMLVGECPSRAPVQAAAMLQDRGVPVPIAQVIQRCLSVDPAGRPRAASEVVEAITAVSGSGLDATACAPTVAQGAAPMTPMANATTVAASPPRQPRLGVLPFRYRGPKEQEYLGDGLTDELVDALSRTRGLLVLGSGATARFAATRDPLAIHRELRADAVVDGAVQAGGDRVRVSVRLLDGESGVQRWVQQLDGSLSELFDFQVSTAQRVAEVLRVELPTMVQERTAPTAALEHYLAARHELRAPSYGASKRGLELLEEALALAPAFAPAIAAHALAAVRCWFLAVEEPDRDWPTLAAESIASARRHAGEVAETHLAVGVYETQRGHYKEAVFALARALELAPTCAAAHEHLGILQTEAGHLQSGIEHLRLAVDLDPSRVTSWGTLARAYAIRGDRAAFEATLLGIERLARPDRAYFLAAVQQRDAAWRRDIVRMRELLASSQLLDTTAVGKLGLLCARAVVGEATIGELVLALEDLLSRARSPRMKSLLLQFGAEALAATGEQERALSLVASAAQTVLVDICWLERCPLLDELRARPEFIEALALTRARASEIWAS